jgi:UDP-glucuronate 4-epimerase
VNILPKLLVTGCAGFIGSNFVDEACKSGYHVLGIDSLNGQLYSPQIKLGNLSIISGNSNFSFVNSDIGIFEGASKAEYLINFAGLPGQRLSWQIPFEYNYANIIAPINLVKNLSAYSNLKHIIHISTSSVYGKAATDSEESLLEPISPYGDSKLAAEFAMKGLAKSLGIKLTILRLFSVYGPRQRPDMAFYKIISSLLSGDKFNLYGSGEQSRTNTYVGDLCAWILQILESDIEGVFNLGGGEEFQLLEIIEHLEKMSGLSLNLNFHESELGDQIKTTADCTKIFDKLPFRPSTKVFQGLQQQFEWQQKISTFHS